MEKKLKVWIINLLVKLHLRKAPCAYAERAAFDKQRLKTIDNLRTVAEVNRGFAKQHSESAARELSRSNEHRFQAGSADSMIDALSIGPSFAVETSYSSGDTSPSTTTTSD